MLKNTAKSANTGKRRGKAALIIPRPIMLATPALKVHGCHWSPKLAWWMRNNREDSAIPSRITLFRPRIDRRVSGIAAIWLNEQSSNLHHQSSFTFPAYAFWHRGQSPWLEIHSAE
jgi:hypothetical protein